MYNLLFPNISESMSYLLNMIKNLIDLIFIVFFIIASWKLFVKFGEKPWKSLIPFYSVYLLYKRTWVSKAFWVYCVSLMLGDFLFRMSETLVKNDTDNLLASVFLMLSVPFFIAEMICFILSALRMAEAFGKKKIFAVGLVLFQELFVMILGFGKSKYLYAKEPVEETGEEIASVPEQSMEELETKSRHRKEKTQ